MLILPVTQLRAEIISRALVQHWDVAMVICGPGKGVATRAMF